MPTPIRILLSVLAAAVAAAGLNKLKRRHQIWLDSGSFGSIVHHNLEEGQEEIPIDVDLYDGEPEIPHDIDPVIPDDLDLDPEKDDDDD